MDREGRYNTTGPGVAAAIDGSPVSNAQVSIMDPLSASGGVLKFTRSDQDGVFVIPGVAPGRYEMQAGLYPDGLFGLSEVTVAGQDVWASIVLWPGMTVSGRMVFDRSPASTSAAATTTTPSGAAPLILSREKFSTGGYRFAIEPDGKFVFSNVPIGMHRLRNNGRPPAGWVLRSIMINGVDVSDTPFEVRRNENIDNVVVTLTDRPAEISGTLQTASGDPAPDYVLVVYSADPRFHVPRSRRTEQVRPDVKGRFIGRDLPAGDYLISAVTDLEDGRNDPAFLGALAASSPVKISLAEGDKKIQDIRIGR